MRILAKQNRELIMINPQNTQNENDAEKIIIQVPEQYEDFNKKIVFITPDGIVWDLILNNEYLIKKAITKYQQVDFYIWLTKGDVDFRSQTKTLKLYKNQDASEEITDDEIGAVNTIVNLLEEEITKVENMDIDAVKVGDTATIMITNKEGQTKTIAISDGEKGDTGERGEPGTTDYSDLENKPKINNVELNGNKSLQDIGIIEVTEQTVAGWGFTKNTGTYSKPSGGIPKTDLESSVQTSLNKADTALQTHQDISGKLNTSQVKNTNSTTAGDVYDVRYINSMIGDIEILLRGV